MSNPAESGFQKKQEDTLKLEHTAQVGDSLVLKENLNEYLQKKIPAGIESGKTYVIERWPSDMGTHTVFVRPQEDAQAAHIEVPVSLLQQG